MESELDLIKMQDKVFEKIGRNLLNFQKIEQLLKLLIANGRVSGHMSELNEIRERQVEAVHKQTMGNLVGKFVDNTLLSHEEFSQIPFEPKEPYFSFSFNVKVDADFYEGKKQALKSLVDDRNDLIHHLLPRFNPESIESCLETEHYLDQQREKLIPEYDFLKSLLIGLKEGIDQHADFLNSEEGIKQIELSFLQQSPLVTLLLNISIQQPRSDGWTLLGNAVRQLRTTLPDEMGRLKTSYGYKTVKELIHASEFFDIKEEITKKGGVRVLYRPKPELACGAFNRLLNSLLDTSRRTARADGWTLLSTAGQEIEQSLTEDFALVREKWGYESLKELILESELFDIIEEPFDKGDAIQLYRPKAELATR
jgi:hypothetical protein